MKHSKTEQSDRARRSKVPSREEAGTLRLDDKLEAVRQRRLDVLKMMESVQS